jgi:hypothetical protein
MHRRQHSIRKCPERLERDTCRAKMHQKYFLVQSSVCTWKTELFWIGSWVGYFSQSSCDRSCRRQGGTSSSLREAQRRQEDIKSSIVQYQECIKETDFAKSLTTELDTTRVTAFAAAAEQCNVQSQDTTRHSLSDLIDLTNGTLFTINRLLCGIFNLSRHPSRTL